MRSKRRIFSSLTVVGLVSAGLAVAPTVALADGPCGSDVQDFVGDDFYYDGANFISGVIPTTTDAADSPVMELNVNGSKATASAS